MAIPMNNYKIQLLKILPGISGDVHPEVQNRNIIYFILSKTGPSSYHYNLKLYSHRPYYYIL